MFIRALLFYFSILFLLITADRYHSRKKLDIDIYYETFDVECVDFFNEQLAPHWRDLDPHVIFNLIPFGHSKDSMSGQSYICENGPEECVSNAMHSCVLDMLQRDQSAQLQFVICAMSRESYAGGWRKCVEDVGLNSTEVNECLHSDSGRVLQLSAEMKTEKAGIRDLPTILFDGKFHKQKQIMALRNFKHAVCLELHNIEGLCEYNRITNVYH